MLFTIRDTKGPAEGALHAKSLAPLVKAQGFGMTSFLSFVSESLITSVGVMRH